MRILLTTLSLAAATAALPANAATFDAFSSFTGTATAGAFTYGSFDGTTFTAYNDTPGCAAYIAGTICTSNGGLPGAFKSTTGAHQTGSVLVPADALVFHPGANAGQAAAVVFTVATSGYYRFDASAFVADTNPSGVDLFTFSPGRFVQPIGSLSAASPTASGSFTAFAAAGRQIGVAVDYAGSYNNDSTGINFTVTQVPEPATWSLLIAGFAMTGFAARRRHVARAA